MVIQALFPQAIQALLLQATQPFQADLQMMKEIFEHTLIMISFSKQHRSR